MHLSVVAGITKAPRDITVCRQVRKVAICMRMTFVLKRVPVSYRLHIIYIISFPYTAANWTLLCVSFSRLARPVITTSRGMPLIYFCVHLSIHFRPVASQIWCPNLHFEPQRYRNLSSSSICRIFSTDKQGRRILLVFNFVDFVAALCIKVTSPQNFVRTKMWSGPQCKLLRTAWGARPNLFKGAYRPLRHISYCPLGFWIFD
jgi:hypothetical protein